MVRFKSSLNEKWNLKGFIKNWLNVINKDLRWVEDGGTLLKINAGTISKAKKNSQGENLHEHSESV